VASCGGTTGREHLAQPVSAGDASSDVFDPGDAEVVTAEETSVDAVSDRHRIPKDGFSAIDDMTDGGGVDGEAGAPTSTCGNGTVEPGEECDDGNTLDADGCSSFCANTKTCDDCLKENCDPDLLPLCSNLKDQGNAEQGPGKGAPRQDLCRDLYSCALKSGCAFVSAQEAAYCYCGARGGSACFAAKGLANGDCKAEIEAASESTEPVQILGSTSSPVRGSGPAILLLQ